jgi:phage/plasmid-like protein (TIGR03299 family)
MTTTTPEAPAVDLNADFFTRRRAMGGAMIRQDDGTWVPATGTTDPAHASTPPWVTAGMGALPAGISDVDEVLRKTGLDWDVELVESTYPWKGETLTYEGKYTSVHGKTGAPFGTVGGTWEPWHNADFFEFLFDLVDGGEAMWESGGQLNGGKKVFACLRLPENIAIEGTDDMIVPFLTGFNSHDGRSQARVMTLPWRPWCANQERVAVKEAVTSWAVRHCRSRQERQGEARDTLRLTIKYYEKYAAEMGALVRTDMMLDEFRSFIDELWTPKPDAKPALLAKAEERRDTLTQVFELEASQVGRNAYAAERAVTSYFDWLTPLKPSSAAPTPENVVRGTRAMVGDHDDKKNVAHQKLMLLVRH